MRKISKYRNTKVEYHNMKFASNAELHRWIELEMMQRHGLIKELRREVWFDLIPAVVLDGRKKPAIRYRADSVYTDAKTGVQTVEDVKGGAATPMFRLKKHLLMHIHGIEIKEYRKCPKKSAGKKRTALRTLIEPEE